MMYVRHNVKVRDIVVQGAVQHITSYNTREMQTLWGERELAVPPLCVVRGGRRALRVMQKLHCQQNISACSTLERSHFSRLTTALTRTQLQLKMKHTIFSRSNTYAP